jgi:hypothetical protein
MRLLKNYFRGPESVCRERRIKNLGRALQRRRGILRSFSTVSDDFQAVRFSEFWTGGCTRRGWARRVAAFAVDSGHLRVVEFQGLSDGA